MKRKFPVCLQLETNDCGASCIQMICEYYGKKIELDYLKNICNITKQGLSVSELIKCANSLGLKAAALKCNLELFEEFPLPVILYWRKGHFVVLYKIQKRNKQTFYHIVDPAFGTIKLSEKDFCYNLFTEKEQKAYAILFEPSSSFHNLCIPHENKKKNWNLFFYKYKNFNKSICLSILLLVIAMILNWLSPIMFQFLVDEGIGKHNVSNIWIFFIAQTLFCIGYLLSNNFSSILLMKMNFSISIEYLSELVLKITNLPVKYFDSKLKTEFIQRMDDQARLQRFLSFRVIDIIVSVLSFIVFASLLAYYNAIIFAIFILLAIVSFWWSFSFLKTRRYLDYSRYEAQSRNRNAIYELLDGMLDIKTNNAQEERIKFWRESQETINEISLKALYLNYKQMLGSSFMDRFRDIVIFVICSFLIFNSHLSIGVLLTISYILGQLTSYLSQMYHLGQDIQDANISLKRINCVFNKEDEACCGTLELSEAVESLKVKNISFRYPNTTKEDVIQDISFDIPINQTTAIVGHSGSGKTTIIKLLLGFYFPHKGCIEINNLPLSQISVDSWRRKCGAVLQDGYIFSGTIAENIALGHNEEQIDYDRIEYCIEQACLSDFIRKLSNGYHTIIGNTGVSLSGGQKQRILIARALYKNPEILIFDEATSHLDAENEKRIMENLLSNFKNKTLIIIAHRLSTVVNADKILFVGDGKIQEEGNHSELYALEGSYYNLVKNQLEINE